jgi:hypothetical protein
VSELGFELAAEDRERLPVEVKGLEDDGRTGLELGERAVDVDRPGEAGWSPGDVDRVIG